MSNPSIKGRMVVADDANALARLAAEWFVQTATAQAGDVRMSLSGGSTPKALYHLLGSEPFRARIPWNQLELFWGDERFVSHDSPDSNYHMTREALLGVAPIPPDRIHAVPTD